MEWSFFAVLALVIAVVSASGAYFANMLSPQRTVRQLLDRTISWLAIGVLVLTLGGCAYFLQMKCPAYVTVCDGPIMAAGGIVMIGAIAFVEIIVVGVPVAFATLKLLRRP